MIQPVRFIGGPPGRRTPGRGWPDAV